MNNVNIGDIIVVPATGSIYLSVVGVNEDSFQCRSLFNSKVVSPWILKKHLKFIDSDSSTVYNVQNITDDPSASVVKPLHSKFSIEGQFIPSEVWNCAFNFGYDLVKDGTKDWSSNNENI